MKHPLVQEIPDAPAPERLVEQLRGEPGVVLLLSALHDSSQGRYSYVTARPLLTVRSYGARSELTSNGMAHVRYGDPWRIIEELLGRFELLDELDVPFPLGGCFGYWGYDLKHFREPRLPRKAINDLELPDCHLGFYDSLVVFDHWLNKTWIVSTGLQRDGSLNPDRAREQFDFWNNRLAGGAKPDETPAGSLCPDSKIRHRPNSASFSARTSASEAGSRFPVLPHGPDLRSTLSREGYIAAVERAQRYIRAGDIYQVNLSHRLEAHQAVDAWQYFQRLREVSPAPFAAYLDCGNFQLISSSPELFLRLSGSQIQTRPIKGTRPRSADPDRDAQLTYELQTSEKEMAELVMITDLLRNDLGKVCEYGSVRVPELVRLERYAQVQHLVSTVQGRLRRGITHGNALADCFPGGSITGAPKIRAMEIIDELEPVARGPYTGCLGYLGFNRESQLSIVIRSAICAHETVFFSVGAGIVADSSPEAEYEETLAKAQGLIASLESLGKSHPDRAPTPEPFSGATL